ncbi:MAG: hypothetical protein M1476_03545 [Candidatus Thermoplasmatota archaeon]|nr:hypothetical protein [Candidatus Thermoplasmatota archaeon]
MNSNTKGWIGFAIVAVLIIGGAFGTSHILPTSTTGISISNIASSNGGNYVANNQTYVVNVSDSSSGDNFTVSMTSTVASGSLNVSIISQALLNSTLFNLTYNTMYNKLYNQSVNSTEKAGITLNNSVNQSIKQNASANATVYAYQNATINLFSPIYMNTTFTGGTHTFNISISLNSSALKLLNRNEVLFATINLASGPYVANGNIMFVKV